jgi:hypothetical protein
LEYIEDLVKLVRKKKDVEVVQTHLTTIMHTPTIRQVCINKTNRNKTLHLVVEINRTLIEGLVDNGASMLVMAPSVVKEFNIMHLVSSHEMYKIMSRTIT